jgi:hypothetical protein
MQNLVKIIFVSIFMMTTAIQAQTYTLEQTAVAGGGIDAAAGGAFGLSATSGQAAARGALRGGMFAVTIGFWNPQNLPPTAAQVTISGRVVAFGGLPISNARLVLSDGSGAARETRTNGFGYYRFADVPVGEIYVLTVSSKRYVFAEPTRIFSLNEDLAEVDFTSVP